MAEHATERRMPHAAERRRRASFRPEKGEGLAGERQSGLRDELNEPLAMGSDPFTQGASAGGWTFLIAAALVALAVGLGEEYLLLGLRNLRRRGPCRGLRSAGCHAGRIGAAVPRRGSRQIRRRLWTQPKRSLRRVPQEACARVRARPSLSSSTCSRSSPGCALKTLPLRGGKARRRVAPARRLG